MLSLMSSLVHDISCFHNLLFSIYFLLLTMKQHFGTFPCFHMSSRLLLSLVLNICFYSVLCSAHHHCSSVCASPHFFPAQKDSLCACCSLFLMLVRPFVTLCTAVFGHNSGQYVVEYVTRESSNLSRKTPKDRESPLCSTHIHHRENQMCLAECTSQSRWVNRRRRRRDSAGATLQVECKEVLCLQLFEHSVLLPILSLQHCIVHGTVHCSRSLSFLVVL